VILLAASKYEEQLTTITLSRRNVFHELSYFDDGDGDDDDDDDDDDCYYYYYYYWHYLSWRFGITQLV
jgi:hypothetical protein